MRDDHGTNTDLTINNIKALAVNGQKDEAAQLLKTLLEETFEFKVVDDTIRFDTENSLALNSFRAEFKTQGGEHLFLKSHCEEGEGARFEEYYRAKILEEAGFPIDPPLYQCSVVGRQMVIYSFADRQKTPELHGLARTIEANGCQPDDMKVVVEHYDDFQRKIGELYLKTLHMASAEEVASEAIHGLFHRRLVVDSDRASGTTNENRLQKFYEGKDVPLPDGSSASYEDFQNLTWRINGLDYNVTLNQAYDQARQLLDPKTMGSMAAVTAHGDDHTGNLIHDQEAGEFKYFDPAFAGNDVPALIAGCKAMYHVNFAHPHMLYDPAEFDNEVKAVIEDGVISIEHDWDLTPLRQSFLDSQLEHVWKPLIKEMSEQGILPDNWEDIVRSTLFLCPTVCKNLIAGLGSPNPLTPEASMMTFAISIQLAAAPKTGNDRVSEFFQSIKSTSL